MGIPGYAGRILYIDLTSGRTRKEPIDPELVMTLIGGYGINNKLAYDLIPQRTDPLSPASSIIIGAGPFAGTLVPGAAKVLVTTKFPINGAFATAAAGGSFALMLKSVGYDHLVISGRAQRPVFLRITEENVELCDAMELWGKDSFDTVDRLRSRYEPCSVIPIGQAGENLVKISITLLDKAGTLGRGGLPAIMGSKNLKAIVVQQGTVETSIAHRLAFQRLANNLHERILRWPSRQSILDNGQRPTPPDITELHQKTRKPLACPSCPLADKQVVMLSEGQYAGLQTYMPHVTINRFNARSSAEAYEQSIKYLDTLNRYGLCEMNFSSLLSTVVYLYQEGVITKEDTGGIELKDDIETALKLAQMTAYREGFGEVLAEGLVGAAQRIGKRAEEHIEHIKGRSISLQPKAGWSRFHRSLSESTPPRRQAGVAPGGSRHLPRGGRLSSLQGTEDGSVLPRKTLKRVVGPMSFNTGRYSSLSEDSYSLFKLPKPVNRAHVDRFYHVERFGGSLCQQ